MIKKNVDDGYYLKSYVGDFSSKLTSAFPELDLGTDLGDYEYIFPTKDFWWLVRYLDMRGASVDVAGSSMYSIDQIILDPESSIFFVVLIIYNQMTERLKFIPQTYTRLGEHGVFSTASTPTKLLKEYHREATINMMNTLG